MHCQHEASTRRPVAFKMPGLNSVDDNIWVIFSKIHQTWIAFLDDLKHEVETELAKVDHIAVIAAAMCHWPHHLSTWVYVALDNF